MKQKLNLQYFVRSAMYLPTMHGKYSTRKFPRLVSVIFGINSFPAGSYKTYSP